MKNLLNTIQKINSLEILEAKQLKAIKGGEVIDVVEGMVEVE